jgi:hypothetical protein
MESTIIRLTLEVFDKTGVYKTGVYNHACLAWCEKATVDQTLNNYKVHFTAANKERKCKRKLTAQAAEFHGGNAIAATNNHQCAVAAAPPTGRILIGDVKMSYCWTHGLTTNCDHNSDSCSSKRDGHINTATVLNMQGGNNCIYTPRPRECPAANGKWPSRGKLLPRQSVVANYDLVKAALPDLSDTTTAESSPHNPQLHHQSDLLANTGTTSTFISIEYPVINKQMATKNINNLESQGQHYVLDPWSQSGHTQPTSCCSTL